MFSVCSLPRGVRVKPLSCSVVPQNCTLSCSVCCFCFFCCRPHTRPRVSEKQKKASPNQNWMLMSQMYLTKLWIYMTKTKMFAQIKVERKPHYLHKSKLNSYVVTNHFWRRNYCWICILMSKMCFTKFWIYMITKTTLFAQIMDLHDDANNTVCKKSKLMS